MKHSYILLLSIFILVVSRLIPHPPNFSPIIVITLLLAREYKLPMALLSVLLSFLITDILLGWWQGHAWFGNWSLYTYSALFIITSFSIYLHCFGFLSAINSTVFYWCWTNFGVWLMSGMYAHSSLGFMACFIAALPFLSYSLIGTLAWYIAIYSFQTKELGILTTIKVTPQKVRIIARLNKS